VAEGFTLASSLAQDSFGGVSVVSGLQPSAWAQDEKALRISSAVQDPGHRSWDPANRSSPGHSHHLRFSANASRGHCFSQPQGCRHRQRCWDH